MNRFENYANIIFTFIPDYGNLYRLSFKMQGKLLLLNMLAIRINS